MENFEKYLMAHQYMPKKFRDPHKNSPTPPPPPTYLMYSPLSRFVAEIYKYDFSAFSS